MKRYKLLEDIILRIPYYDSTFSVTNTHNISNINAIVNSYWDDKSMREAIYIATSNLYYRILKNKLEVNSKEWLSLYKYILRASARCTPFGLFAGLSVAKWSNRTEFTLQSDLARTTRIDMG